MQSSNCFNDLNRLSCIVSHRVVEVLMEAAIIDFSLEFIDQMCNLSFVHLRFTHMLRARAPAPHKPATQSLSIFFVGAGFVDGDAAEILGQLDEALVAVVPFGAGLVEEHASLKGPAQLHEASLPRVGA